MNSNSEVFCQACIDGDLSKVDELLQIEPQLVSTVGMVHPDHREFMKKEDADYGWSPLHLAGHYGQKEIVEKLIQLGADINSVSQNGIANTPLAAAIGGGQTEIAEILLKNGAKPE